MIVNKERHFQHIYLLLSGTVASTLVILVYLSVNTVNNELFRNDLKTLQRSLHYKKPSTQWDYNNTWKPIGHKSMGHEIYSAYFDSRIDNLDPLSGDKSRILAGSVRVFAILPTNFDDVVDCILRLEDFTVFKVPATEAKPIQEHHDEDFAACTITCPLFRERNDNQSVQLPQAIAIAYSSNNLSQLSPTFIPISYPKDMSQLFSKSLPVISVCVGPLHSHYSNVLRIAEFVEMYRLLGASHFYFYDMDSSRAVRHLLNHYRTMGIADVLAWNLEGHTSDLHYYGIVAQFNDCVYRAMVVDNYRYAVVVDLDEILVPLKHNTLRDFLHQCDEGRTSAFVFRNVFFYNKDSNDTFSVPTHTRNRMLYTQTKVRRSTEIMPAYVRSKCIVNTHSIVEMGNHRMWHAASGYADSIVHPTVGLLFHYRDKCINCKSVLTVDFTARRFGSLIWDRVDEICLQVFLQNNGTCPLS